jgi:predicted secreted protein
MWFRRLGLILFMTTCVLISTACMSQEEALPTSTSEPPDTIAPTRTLTPQPISVAGPHCPKAFREQDQVRRGVQINTNSVLTLTLGATPSMPWGWELPEMGDEAVLHQVDHDSVWPAEGVEPKPGAPGTEIWVFEPHQAGESTVSLTCKGPGEEGSSEEVVGTFVLHVVVQ